jgi:hypothetical protein
MIEIPEDGWGAGADPALDEGGSVLTGRPRLDDRAFAVPDWGWSGGAEADDDPVTQADSARERAGGVFRRQRRIGAFNRELDDLFTTIAEGPDWSDGLERFDRKVGELRQKHAGDLRDPEDRDAFDRHAGDFTAMQRIGLKRALVERQASDALTQLDDQLAYYAGKAAGAGHDVFRQMALDTGVRAIDELHEAGYLTPEGAEKRKTAFLGQVDEADVKALAAADPAETISALDGGLFARLDPEMREKLRTQIAASIGGPADGSEAILDSEPPFQPGDELAMAKRRPDGSHLPPRPGEGILEGGGGVGAGGGPTRSPSTPTRREPTASDPVGRRHGRELEIPKGTNPRGTIEGREYSGHALDKMQKSGLSPSAVEHTIHNGVTTTGKKGEHLHFDPANKMTVITDPQSGRVITVWPGEPNKSKK